MTAGGPHKSVILTTSIIRLPAPRTQRSTNTKIAQRGVATIDKACHTAPLAPPCRKSVNLHQLALVSIEFRDAVVTFSLFVLVIYFQLRRGIYHWKALFQYNTAIIFLVKKDNISVFEIKVKTHAFACTRMHSSKISGHIMLYKYM